MKIFGRQYTGYLILTIALVGVAACDPVVKVEVGISSTRATSLDCLRSKLAQFSQREPSEMKAEKTSALFFGRTKIQAGHPQFHDPDGVPIMVEEKETADGNRRLSVAAKWIGSVGSDEFHRELQTRLNSTLDLVRDCIPPENVVPDSRACFFEGGLSSRKKCLE